jgi:hypothetical protein
MRLAARLALFALFLPTVAAAQNRGIFVQAGPLLDVLQQSSFDETVTATLSFDTSVPVTGGLLPTVPSDEQTRSTNDRFAPGGVVALGVFVSPSVSLRLEASFQGGHVTAEETSSAREEYRYSFRNTSRTTDLTVAAAWHQGDGRTSISYLGGIVFRRQRNDTFTSFTYPNLVVRNVGGRLVQVIEPETEEDSHEATLYDKGVMAGIDVTVNLSSHLALVPQVRLVGQSYSWNVRPAVALRWRP